MSIVSSLFFISLLFGTASGVSLFPGVTVYIHDMVLVLLFLTSFVYAVLKRQFIQPKLLLPIAGFAAAAIISLLLNTFRFSSAEIWQGSLYLFRWIAYSGLYVIVVQRRVAPEFWLLGLLGTGIGFGILGILQYMLYSDLRNLMYLGWDPHYFRLFSTLLDPNFAGIILVLSIFLSFFFLKGKLGMLGGLGILGTALLLTYSRSSYLAFTAGALYLFFQSKQSRAKGLIAILLFLFIIVVIPKPGGDTLRLDRMVTTVARIENWQESIQKIGESPLFGFGFDTLRFVEKDTQGADDLVSKAGAGVDSSLLFILLTTGVLGFTAYCFLIYRQCIAATTLMVRRNHAVIGYIFIASMIAVLVHSLFVNSLFYPWVMVWMWILMGVVEAFARDPLIRSAHSG